MVLGSLQFFRLEKVSRGHVSLQSFADVVHSFVARAKAESFSYVTAHGILGIASRQKTSSIHFGLFRRASRKGYCPDCQSYRYSVISDVSNELRTDGSFTAFFKAAIDNHKGPNYLWLNRNQRQKEVLKKGRPFIVLSGAFLNIPIDEMSPENIIAFQTLRSLLQSHPSLQVLGFQSGSSVCSVASQRQVLKAVMEEYITYPILLTENVFNEIPGGPSYLIFCDFDRPYVNLTWHLELPVIEKELKRLEMSCDGALAVIDSGSSKGNIIENIDGPHACSPFKNLLFYYPSCVSADDQGHRLFISDTNHHRIIVTDGDGEFLDCIGSSPGFEDGNFDSSKLLRPAGSLYRVDDDCLYFVDAENCAVRRADLQKRVVETLYPPSDKKLSSLWGWILDKIGIRGKDSAEEKEPEKSILSYPWHLIMSGEDNLLVFSRGFETLWVMNIKNGKINNVHKGFSNIMEAHEKMIMGRTSSLEEILSYLNHPAPSKMRHLDLLSTAAKLQNDIIYCDAVGHRIIKYQKKFGQVAKIPFTNFGILGVPYWVPPPLEHVAFREEGNEEKDIDHLQRFNVLPGRCGIKIIVHVPEGTLLAAPLSEQSVWRQARGAAAEISSPALAAASADKVGIAQQWFDELDNLAFAPVESSSTEQIEHAEPAFDPKMLTIDCTVNTSPGTSEVVVSAVLYLRLEDTRHIDRLLTAGKEKSTQEPCVDFLLDSCEDVREIVFSRPLRVRLRLDCGDHPMTSSRELVPSECSLQVNVNLV